MPNVCSHRPIRRLATLAAALPLAAAGAGAHDDDGDCHGTVRGFDQNGDNVVWKLRDDDGDGFFSDS